MTKYVRTSFNVCTWTTSVAVGGPWNPWLIPAWPWGRNNDLGHDHIVHVFRESLFLLCFRKKSLTSHCSLEIDVNDGLGHRRKRSITFHPPFIHFFFKMAKFLCKFGQGHFKALLLPPISIKWFPFFIFWFKFEYPNSFDFKSPRVFKRKDFRSGNPLKGIVTIFLLGGNNKMRGVTRPAVCKCISVVRSFPRIFHIKQL